LKIHKLQKMENRTRLPGGSRARSRAPLGDLTARENNRLGGHQASTAAPGPLKPQSFNIFRDETSSSSSHPSSRLAPPSRYNDENQAPNVKVKEFKEAKNSNSARFPPPPPIPLATSSPSIVTKPQPQDSTEANPVTLDPYALISKSSASDFRRNNDSISSTTTNEEDFDLEEEDIVCDDVSAQVTEAAQASVDAEDKVVIHHDAEQAGDEYALDILKSLMEREVNYMPKWNYMTKQPDITFTMRSILIDWLVEVGEEYKLSTETLFLAVNYIDRFLSFMSVQRAKLQLVGTACMFIAAKYEEIYPPDVSEFCYITDDTYTKRQVLRMEQLVLGVINFECAPPTAHFFVNHLAKLAECGPRATALAQYLTELTLIDGEAFLPFSQSLIAASAVALARHTLGLAAWEDSMVAKTGYNVEDFKECLIRLHETFERAPEMQQQAVREKYKNASYHSVSEVKPTPIF